MKRTGLLLGLVFAVAVTAATVSAQGSPSESAQHLRSLVDTYETKDFWAKASRPQSVPGREGRRPRKENSFSHAGHGPPELRARSRAPRAHARGSQQPSRRLASGAERLVPAVRPPGVGDHGARPGQAPSRIKTYSGRGITDLTATIHADLTPLGFRASVRSANGTWYIDPYYVGRAPASMRATSAGMRKTRTAPFVEHVSPTPPALAQGPESQQQANNLGRIARADHRPGVLHVLRRAAVRDRSQGRAHEPRDADLRGRPDDSAAAGREQRSPQSQQLCAGGRAQRALRRRRLFHPGPGHRVFEHDARPLRDRPDHRSIELRHRPPRAGPARRGRRQPRRGRPLEQGRWLHRVPTPVGDFFAVDYVAHEMGHQFAGNHTFNGNQLNCSGGNRNGSTSVEPGSGQSIMAYAGICLTDDLQPHSDGYFSERSQQEITTFVSSNLGRDQRGADGLASPLRRRRRGPGRHVRTGLRPGCRIAPLSVSINAAAELDVPRGAEENGTSSRSRPGRRIRSRSVTSARSPASASPATTAPSRSRPSRPRGRSSTPTR